MATGEIDIHDVEDAVLEVNDVGASVVEVIDANDTVIEVSGSYVLAPAVVGHDGADGKDGKDGIDGIDGKDGQPRFQGDGPPAELIVGANPNDLYLDRQTGLLYRLS